MTGWPSIRLTVLVVWALVAFTVTTRGAGVFPLPSGTSPTNASFKPLTSLPVAMELVFRTQLALARAGFSPGSIDGVMGAKTVSALRGFQLSQGLPNTGQCDEATKSRLQFDAAPLRYRLVESNDLARLRPLGQTWLSKSQQERLEYESIVELVAEQSQASPTFIQRLNPGVSWSDLKAGARLIVPNAESPSLPGKAAFIKIDLAQRILRAYGEGTNLLVQFPCSIGQQVYQRPVGVLQVEVIIPDPNYTFNPAVFPESEEAQRLGRKLILPPGPNNPVGLAWIGLNRPGFGIHGTPKPEQVGSAESHGCFRLANWNAQLLSNLVWVSMPVYIVEGAGKDSPLPN